MDRCVGVHRSGGRDLRALPKAHLHLHFTGSLRPATLLELAASHGVHLPDTLRGVHPPELRATDERGWFRFQRLYDTARSVVRGEHDIRRLLHEAAEDERSEGSGWLEIQIDPTSYAPWLGGLTPTVDVVLDAAREAAEATGVGIAVLVAANRTRHPLDARTLARLAAMHAGRGVVGFGLSNDERRGRTEDFAGAFRIAARAGLLAAPHGGELSGPGHVRTVLDALGAQRVGHGVRSAEDPALLDRLAADGVTLEVCPVSNVRMGVYDHIEDVPLRRLRDAGVSVALGADDPLLFGSRLLDQYEAARTAHGFTDDELAELARCSVRASCAPDDVRDRLLKGIDDWLASPPGTGPGSRDTGPGSRDIG
ncbi:MAG TPA: adenosine deaminase [Actinomycetes bacterium]